MADAIARRVFKFLNRFFMVPVFRLGLGSFMGNPLSGYVMVLRTVGRKTGKTRYVPVNYAIMNGHVYCLAGFGAASQWYRNVQAQPNLEMIMPSGGVSGAAEEVTDPAERLCVVRQILKNGGFAGFFMGFNPWTAPDTVVVEKMKGSPLLRITTNGLGSGAGDPGGLAWVLAVALTLAVIVLLVS